MYDNDGYSYVSNKGAHLQTLSIIYVQELRTLVLNGIGGLYANLGD